MKGFPAAARETLRDAQLRRNLGKATTTIRAKRLATSPSSTTGRPCATPARRSRRATMATLPEQLEQLEASVTAAGGIVHWARDGAEANRSWPGIAQDHGARELIKVKSIATDEIGLNEALAAEGIEAIETDLAELIIQLAGERSSHILVPAIHKNRAEIRACSSARSPRARTSAGRRARSPRRRAATCARSSSRCRSRSRGANFGVAETGTSRSSSPRATGACARRCPRCSSP